MKERKLHVGRMVRATLREDRNPGFWRKAHVLGGWRRGLGFAAMLGTLYASLYGLLISEDNAMVLGAGLLFLILAAIMVLTRRVDWYRAARLPPLPGRPA